MMEQAWPITMPLSLRFKKKLAIALYLAVFHVHAMQCFCGVRDIE
jgi:hypothetical protein